MTVDPFSPEADPGRDEVQQAPRTGRREILVSLSVVPALTALGATGCTSLVPACPTQPQAGTCSHRFCRYHRG